MGKVTSTWKELTTELAQNRQGKKVVFTNGCFDILHVGHVRYLQEARAQGDLLVVGLNTDASVSRIKGPDRPVNDESTRAEILAALGCVDYVTFFGEETPIELIREVRPDVLVKGGDYTIDRIVGAAFVTSYGGQVKALQFSQGHSTSALIEKIRKL